jgi:HlyD family secretion protein
MSSRGKVVIGVALFVVLGAATAVTLVKGRDRGVEVRLEEVQTRDLVSTVTVSGNVRARRAVDISADVMGRIMELNVEEGEDVSAGMILLRIDPSQHEAAVSRAQATLSQAQAQVAQQRANLLRAEREHGRMEALWSRDSTLVSPLQLEEAATNLEVARSLFQAAEHGVDQSDAALKEAQNQLSKTIIRAPISGKVTRLNVEAGETVVVGTMNNPGSLILTVSDLSVVEAVMAVDETDVPEITLGDSAVVELDAFSGRRFTGEVTKIGNSAIVRPQATAAGQATAVDFEVVITLHDPGILLRPDLSATADIITAVRESVVSIPIISLTVRSPEEEQTSTVLEQDTGTGQPPRRRGPLAREEEPEAVEGVFVVREGIAHFTPVVIGVTGQEYFEVLSGVEPGDTVVAGPYQRIRELQNGDPVRPLPTTQSAVQGAGAQG